MLSEVYIINLLPMRRERSGSLGLSGEKTQHPASFWMLQALLVENLSCAGVVTVAFLSCRGEDGWLIPCLHTLLLYV